MSDLDKLIEAVEGGECKRELASSLPYPHSKGGTVILAFDGCLNSALTLIDAHLTGAHWHLYEDDDLGFVAGIRFGEWHSASAETPARAMLLAFLRAYRSSAIQPQAHRHS